MKEVLKESTATRLRVPAGKPDVIVFDKMLPGFFLRKFVSGRTSYGIKFTIADRQTYLTLGPAAPGVLKEMRARAAIVLADARAGKNPAAERRAAREPKPAVTTLGALIDRYLADRRSKLRPRYLTEITRQLQQYWKPLHNMTLAEIRRQQLVLIVDDIATERGAVAADRTRAALSGFFGWAMERGLAETSPVENIRPRSETKSRDRTLSEAELVTVWKACGSGHYATIVRLLILTGARRTEIADLRRSEVDLTKCEITLPASRTKNHRTHVIPLSPEAIALLPEPTEGRDFLFGRRRGGFSGWSRAKGELDAAIAATGKPLALWTLHDLRRSFVTHFAERKLATPWVIEALVNHISGSKGGIAGVYNRALHSDEKRDAMLAWGKHVRSLVNT